MKLFLYFYLFLILTSCCSKTMIITRGLPGAGKSTFAKDYQKQYPKIVIVEKDEIRKELFGDKWQDHVLKRESEMKVLSTQFATILRLIKQGKSFIVANTNLEDYQIEIFYILSDLFAYNLVIQDFRNVPLDLCIKRDKQRALHSMQDITQLYNNKVKDYLTAHK